MILKFENDPERVDSARFSSRSLVDIALGGDCVVTDAIYATILRIYERFGNAGRSRMNELPTLSEYPTVKETDAWLLELQALERNLTHETNTNKRQLEDLHQLKFPWS